MLGDATGELVVLADRTYLEHEEIRNRDRSQIFRTLALQNPRVRVRPANPYRDPCPQCANRRQKNINFPQIQIENEFCNGNLVRIFKEYLQKIEAALKVVGALLGFAFFMLSFVLIVGAFSMATGKN